MNLALAYLNFSSCNSLSFVGRQWDALGEQREEHWLYSHCEEAASLPPPTAYGGDLSAPSTVGHHAAVARPLTHT